MDGKINDPPLVQNQEPSAREKHSKEGIANPVVNKDDSCRKIREKEFRTIGDDPRFQQQNQTQRCFVMYTDFYRCEHILGKDSEACTWFKDAFTAICPNAWVQRWDELRVTGRFPWHKHKTQGPFPGCKYGD